MKFFRFNAGLAAVLIAVALRVPADRRRARRSRRAAFVALAVAEAAVVLYWATVGRTLASIRPAIVATACAGRRGRARRSGARCGVRPARCHVRR